MKKNEISAIVNENRNRRSVTLTNYIDTMKKIVNDREQTKSMWFWTDFGNRNARSQKERYYSRNINLPIGTHTLHYDRHISLSRKNAYVSENLTFDDDRATVADLKKLIEGFEVILDKRGACNDLKEA